MLISCTKKLADVLKIKVFEVVPIRREPLFEWHANLFVYNRRKGIIMMNNKTRYSVVLYGLTAEHFRQFNAIELSAIEQTLRAEGFAADVIAKYLRTSAQVIYGKSYDRSILGQINDALFQLDVTWTLDEFMPSDSIYMVEMSKQLSRTPTKIGFPMDLMKNELDKIQ